MFYILLITIWGSFLFSDLDIYSQHLSIDKKNNTAKFVGDVSITRDGDKILADKIDVALNKEQVVKYFLAKDNVQLYYNNEKSNYYFKADSIKFKDNIYTAIGNVYMKNINTKEVITANKISIDRKTDVLKIDGSPSRPVNIKLKIQN